MPDRARELLREIDILRNRLDHLRLNPEKFKSEITSAEKILRKLENEYRLMAAQAQANTSPPNTPLPGTQHGRTSPSGPNSPSGIFSQEDIKKAAILDKRRKHQRSFFYELKLLGYNLIRGNIRRGTPITPPTPPSRGTTGSGAFGNFRRKFLGIILGLMGLALVAIILESSLGILSLAGDMLTVLLIIAIIITVLLLITNLIRNPSTRSSSLGILILIGIVALVFIILKPSFNALGLSGSRFYIFLIIGIFAIILYFFTRKSKSKFWNYDLSNIFSYIKRNLSFKNIIILFLIILVFLFFIWYGVGQKIFAAPLIWIYGILGIILFAVSIHFFTKKNKVAGGFFIILGLFLIILVFVPNILGVLPYNQLRTWLLWGSLFLTIIFLFSKKYKLLGLLFLLITIGIWFLSTDSGSLFLESLGMKAQVAGGETFSARLGKYWGYIKNPEAFFARYGEFGNPNVENKALVGLKIEKFEPLIKEFRTNQDLRFSGEVKHYSLPVFKQGESGAKESSELNIGFSCYIPQNPMEFKRKEDEIKYTIPGDLTPYFADKIDVRPGKTEEVISNGYKEAILKEPLKFKNFTKFVVCTFNQGNVGAIKEKETKQVYLNVSYKDFVTRSDIYAYLLGNDVYQKIEDGVLQVGGDLDTEFLYQLRSAASYPGLIDNERRTVSEFSSGPVWLQVNILDQQPLKSKGSEQYTLRIKSMPNSVDWIGSINVKNIYLVVPSWFNPVSGACDFSDGANAVPGTIEDDVRSRTAYAGSVSSTGVKRLLLNKQNLDDTSAGCAGGGRGCSFLCSFTVNSDGNEQNIQEYRISAYQTTDYSISQGTTFDLIKSRTTGVINENENARQKPSKFMNGLVDSGKKEDLERYISLCVDKKDTLPFGLSQETINQIINPENCKRIEEVKGKLENLKSQQVENSNMETTAGGLDIYSMLVSPVASDVAGEFKINLIVQTNKPANCKYSYTDIKSYNDMTDGFSESDKLIHNVEVSLPVKTQFDIFYVSCREINDGGVEIGDPVYDNIGFSEFKPSTN